MTREKWLLNAKLENIASHNTLFLEFMAGGYTAQEVAEVSCKVISYLNKDNMELFSLFDRTSDDSVCEVKFNIVDLNSDFAYVFIERETIYESFSFEGEEPEAIKKSKKTKGIMMHRDTAPAFVEFLNQQCWLSNSRQREQDQAQEEAFVARQEEEILNKYGAKIEGI